MSKLTKFFELGISYLDMKSVKGGDACGDCVQSASIACEVSCGGGACNYWECFTNQSGECFGQSYCL